MKEAVEAAADVCRNKLLKIKGERTETLDKMTPLAYSIGIWSFILERGVD